MRNIETHCFFPEVPKCSPWCVWPPILFFFQNLPTDGTKHTPSKPVASCFRFSPGQDAISFGTHLLTAFERPPKHLRHFEQRYLGFSDPRRRNPNSPSFGPQTCSDRPQLGPSGDIFFFILNQASVMCSLPVLVCACCLFYVKRNLPRTSLLISF